MAFTMEVDKALSDVPAEVEQLGKLSATSVFEQGVFPLKVVEVKTSDFSAPPKPLYIVSPEKEGNYPVLLFLHGFIISNTSYSTLLAHIASHGFVAVAPQIYSCICFTPTAELNCAAAVADWLLKSLQLVLPTGIQPNLSKLALAGHSRGGNTAFSLALSSSPITTATFTALLGIDPVAFPIPTPLEKKITNISKNPNSFDMPVLVVGSGLESLCAPEGRNHIEFFKKCEPPRCHVVVDGYGHMDMLDDGVYKLAACVCGKGKSRDLMRRSTGGIVVAFMRAFLEGDGEDLKAIVEGTEKAPTSCTITYDFK